jgi:PAS domain S-box-containing protein
MRALSRLTVVQLVSGLGALSLFVVPSWASQRIAQQWSDYRVAQAQLSAIPAAATLLRLAALTGQHRGTSAGLLGGNQAFREKRAATQREVEQALAAVLDATQQWHAQPISRLRDRVRDDWRSLSHAVDTREITPRESYERHKSLIARQLELLDEVVTVSTLGLDRDPFSHYIALAAFEYHPRVREAIGQLRSFGMGMLSKPSFDPADRARMALMLANARQVFERGSLQVERGRSASPSVVRALAPQLQRRRATFDEAAALIEAEILTDRDPHIPAAVYFATITHALDAQMGFAEATFEILSAEMRSRAEACRRAIAITFAIGLIVSLLEFWLVRTIIRSVRRDIDLREAALHEAARSSAYLSTVLEAAPDAVIILNAAGAIEFVNSQVEKSFGFSRDELLQKSAHILFPPAALPEGALVSADGATGMLAGRVIALECSRKDGASFPVELRLSPAQLGAARHLIMVARDVTERRAMERQLQQSQRMESIGQLTGGLAHDFNNLLGVIVGNLDLLERHVEHDERAMARIRTAQRASMRGSELTKRLLAFAGRQQLNPQPTQVNQLINELLEMLPRTLGPEIRIAVKLATNLPSATVDASGLEGALLNLALNARDAMPGGGKLAIATTLVHLGHEQAAVQTGEIKPGDYVKISVSDTGHGMTQATVAKVFEPFFTTKERGKGTGLGLAMVYGFVRQSNGNIRIYSEVGVGTTFTLYIPLAESGAEAVAIRREAVIAKPIVGGVKGTVLIVDDEVDLLEIAVNYCEELGLTVRHATDGPSAVEIAEREPHVDLLLTDVVMPGGMNGVALAARLRARYPKLKVAYCSGFPSSALAERSQLSVDGPLISKPYLKSEFVQTVRDAIAASPAATEEHAA